jgi:hypothetical protein
MEVVVVVVVVVVFAMGDGAACNTGDWRKGEHIDMR